MRVSQVWPAVLVSLISTVAFAQPAPAISPGPRAEPTPAAAPDGEPEAAPETAPEAAAEPEGPAPETTPEAAPEAPPSSPEGVADSSRTPIVEPRAKPDATGELPPLPARHRLVYSNLLVLRVNPLGAEDRFTLGYNLRLYNKPGALFRDAYLGVAFSPTFSPSITRIGGNIDFAPLTILRFRGAYYLATWYGSDRFKAHPYSTPNQAYGPETLKSEPGANVLGGQAELSALFQVRVKMIALRNEVTFYHNNIRLPTGNDVFYDLRHDVIVPGRGWFMTNDTDLLFISKFGLNAGVRNSLVHVFYPSTVYGPGEDTSVNPNTPMDRIGPVLTYTFFDKPERRFNKPTLVFAAQWWVKHRYRAQGGASEFDQIHQGIPLFLLGFSFTGELVKSKH
jgi:hypothetical protein